MKLTALLITVCMAAHALAAHETPLFRMLDTNSGLPDNNVRNMTMLPDGLMCIQTSTMLNLYNGADCHSYRYNPMEIPYTEYSGLNNSYYDIIDNILWCTTRDHIWYFDLNTRRFCYDVSGNFEEYGISGEGINSFFIDDNGDYCMVNDDKELYICDREAMTVRKISLSRQMETPVIMEQTGHTLWILSRNGILAGFDMEIGTFTSSASMLSANVRSGNSSRMEIVSTSKGDLWIMYDRYLAFYDTGKKQLRQIKKIPLDERDLYTSISIDSEDNLWIGTARSGVSIINSASLEAVTLPYLEQTNGKRIWHHTDISKIYADSRGGIWIATLSEGLLYWHKDIYHLHTINSSTIEKGIMPDEGVKCMVEDNDGSILVGTIKGLLRYDPSDGSMTVPYPQLKDELCISLYKDRKGRIWLGTFYNGAYCISGNSIRHYSWPETSAVDISYYVGAPNFNCVRCFHEDSHGNFWIAVYGGVGLFDTESGTVTLQRERHPETARFMIVRDICEQPDGTLLISGDNGRYLYSPEDDRVITDSTSVNCHKQSNQAIVDDRGLRWIATSEGIVVRDLNSDKEQIITSAHGLPDDNVLSIAADRMGNVWASSFGSITRIIVISDNGEYRFAVSNFGENDGVTAGAFFQNSIIAHSGGNLYFGGAHGICEAVPQQLFQTSYDIMPQISSLEINGKAVDVGEEYNGRVLFRQDLTRAGKIVLKHDESFLRFSFSNLNYANPTHTSYRYKLENFDRDWHEIHSEGLGQATYTFLNPGEYVFKVLAADNDTDWSSKPAEIAVTIRPPFWKSTVAYILYALLATGSLIAAIRFVIEREKQKIRYRREQELRDQREQLDQMKFRFFTNISHELRTPLSLILLPLESLMRDMKGSPEMPRLETMHHNAEELLSLVNHLLDFRKLEMGGEKLNLVVGNICEFTENITAAFSDAAQRKGISIKFDNTLESSGAMMFDKDKMSKIINNILANALKFTPSGGFINVSLSKETDTVSEGSGESAQHVEFVKIEISDTGIGIPSADLEHIFDRFYQSDNAEMVTGTGIGLSLVKQYAEMHGGRVSVTSEVGKGTCFRVEIPMRKKPASAPAEEKLPLPETGTDDNGAAENRPSPENVESSGEKKTVMVVDDNADFRAYMAVELGRNYNVIEATDGADCLKKVSEKEPDVLICDVMMPNMDGFEVTRRIKSNIDTSHIPVILLTARTSDDVRLEGYETGADAYITKPFKMDILEARIRNLIEEKQRRISRFSRQMEIEPSEVTITTIDQKLMSRILECIEKNMDNADYSVEELSSDIGMHRMNLYRKLQSLVGMTPSEFIRSIRLKRAARLLTEDPNLSVSEVSDMVGFNTTKYFSKYFREMFGCNPSQYKGQ